MPGMTLEGECENTTCHQQFQFQFNNALRTPLWLAAYFGHSRLVEILVRVGNATLEARSGELVEIDHEKDLLSINYNNTLRPYGGTYLDDTALFVASERGNYEVQI